MSDAEAPEVEAQAGPLTGLTLAVGGDGYTVTATVAGTVPATGLVFVWGDGSRSVVYGAVATHVYATVATHRVSVWGAGWRIDNTVDTTVATPPAGQGTDALPAAYVPPTPPVAATGATAGIPGTFTPAGCATPKSFAALTGIVATPATAWTAGQYVTTLDLLRAHWSGTAWVKGAA